MEASGAVHTVASKVKAGMPLLSTVIPVVESKEL